MKIKRHLTAATALTLSGALAAPVFAHESRIFPASKNSIRVTVGFLGEPAFEDTFNGLDLFLFTFDKRCPNDPTDFYGNPITAAEIVKIKAEAVYLDKSAPPTGKLGFQIPKDATILKRLEISKKSPVGGVFGDPGHFHSWFKPTHPGFAGGDEGGAGAPTAGGAYGFRVEGEVNTKESEYACEGDSTPTKIPARKAKFSSYWICGAGFRDGTPESRGAFSCIQPIQVFPGDDVDGYAPNKPYSKGGGGHS